MAVNISTVVGLELTPMRLAVDYQANVSVLVVDTRREPDGTMRAVPLRMGFIQQFAPSGSVTAKWGSLGSGPGQFQGPEGIAVDRDGNVYVSDSLNRRVQKISPFGTPLAQWGLQGRGPGRVTTPWGVAVDNAGQVYVTDRGLHRVVILAPDGSIRAEWGVAGTGRGELQNPEGIAVDADRNVYVADTANHRIQVFSFDGVPLTQLGGRGSAPGQFRAPSGVAVDRWGNVFVADTGNFRVQKLSREGESAGIWGGERGPSGAPNWLPADLALDPAGNVHVADALGRRILKLPTAVNPADQARSRATAPPKAPSGPGKTAHEVLGIAPGASLADVTSAYRKLARQYHPDRVADLGPEFSELAERRMKEINAAYQLLRQHLSAQQS